MASYCDRKASTLSLLPGWPTLTIIVSSPPNIRGSTLSALALPIFRKALRLNFRTFSERIIPPSAVDLSQGIAIPRKHDRATLSASRIILYFFICSPFLSVYSLVAFFRCSTPTMGEFSILGEHTILPRIVSVIAIPHPLAGDENHEIGSLLEIDTAETVNGFDHEQVTLTLNLALTLDRTLNLDRGRIFRPLIVATNLESHNVTSIRSNHFSTFSSDFYPFPMPE